MADEVSVRVRILGALRARRDAEEVAGGIDNIGDQAEQADRKVGRLSRSLVILRAAGARLAQDGNRTATSLGKSAGGIRGIWLAAIAASPGLLALAGALGAVAGSAGAALLGAGVLGAGGLSALVVGLSGVGIITGQAVTGFKKVSKALDAYNQAVAVYGHGTRAAVQAQAKLNQAVGQAGGKSVLQAVQAWRSLRQEWNASTTPARRAMAGIFGDAIGAGKKLLPTFSAQTNAGATALRSSLRDVFGLLSNREMRASLRDFGAAFRAMLPNATHGAEGFFVTFVRLARAALPYVKQFAAGFAALGLHLASWSANGARVNTFVGNVVGQFRAWWNLAKALGSLLVHIFATGASTGKGLVVTLTAILQRWDAWVQSARGQTALHSFFTDSANQTKTILGFLGLLVGEAYRVIHALGPAFASSMHGAGNAFVFLGGGLAGAVKLLQLLGPLAGPVVQAFIYYKAAALVAAGAVRLAVLATEAWTGAQWLLNFALDANPVGAVILAVAALAGGFVLAYKKIKPFRDLVDSIVRALKSAVTWMGRLSDKLSINIGGKHGAKVSPLKGLGNGILGALGLPPLLAAGGTVSGTGSWITGEAGPELNTLSGGRVRVQPLTSSQGPNPTGRLLATPAFNVTVYHETKLDGKVIQKSVATVTRDQQNRR